MTEEQFRKEVKWVASHDDWIDGLKNALPWKKRFKHWVDEKLEWFRESIVATFLYYIGIRPKIVRFIDEKTFMFGYGKLNGGIGYWQYNLPPKLNKLENNLMFNNQNGK